LDALEELAETERLLQAYADKRGLQLRPEYPWPGALPPAEQPGPVKHAMWALAGRFPGGAVGRLRHQATFGKVMGFGMDVGLQHTIMVCRLPESVGWVPMLCCRPKELMSNMYYWGGDARKRQSQVFESMELDRRYEVELAPGQSQQWLYQLFTPKFIDWLAHETPRDFGFKLDLGVFTCELPEWRGQEGSTERQVRADYLDRLAQIGGTVAGRIRDEILEEAGSRGISQVDSAEAYAGWANARRHGRIVGSIIGVANLLGGGGEDRSAEKWAKKHGMEPESPAHFHARYIGLAMPGAATTTARGRLPGTDRDGSVAWLEYTSIVDVEHSYVAIVLPLARPGSLPERWVDHEDVGVQAFGDGLDPAALQEAAVLGLGLSTSHDGICVYMKTEGTVAGERIEELAAQAARLSGKLEAAS
jgi:hypothetical protein